mgnify:CR=1 FL=1
MAPRVNIFSSYDDSSRRPTAAALAHVHALRVQPLARGTRPDHRQHDSARPELRKHLGGEQAVGSPRRAEVALARGGRSSILLLVLLLRAITTPQQGCWGLGYADGGMNMGVTVG